MHRILYAVAVSLALSLPGSAQVTCQPNALPAGAESGVFEGEVGPEQVLFFAITPVPSHNLEIAVEGNNNAFSWSDGFIGQDAQVSARLLTVN